MSTAFQTEAIHCTNQDNTLADIPCASVPIVRWGGAGATVPLLGFGYSLAKGVEKAVGEHGWLGVMTGGLSATAGGIAAAVVFAVLMALLFRPGDKR